MSADFDHIVIGSGAGGLVTALELARAGRQVLVLEEGSEKSAAPPFSMAEVMNDYRAGGLTTSLGNAPVSFGEGRALGGGTAVNSGYYFRPDFARLDRGAKDWAIADFGERELGAEFEWLERELEPRALPGPFRSEERWRAAAVGCGFFMESARFLHRWDSARGEFQRRSIHALWRDELNALGAVVMPSHRVARLRRHSGAWAVEGSGPAGDFRFRTPQVFVCAGAIETPALLRRGGVRDNVGNNLRFHAFVRLVAKFAGDIAGDGCPVFPWKFSRGGASYGHSPSFPHLLALHWPERKEDFLRDWRSWASFYGSFSCRGAAKVRNWGRQNSAVFFWLSRADRARARETISGLAGLLRAAGAVELSEGAKAMNFLQAVHLFGSCPMGENRAVCAVDSFGAVHGQRGLRVHDCSLIGFSPGTNPQATVMAVARRNTRAYLREPEPR